MINYTREHFWAVLIAASISVTFVLLGHSFVLQRELNGPTAYLTIRGDALFYIAMIENSLESAPQPYNSRILVPLIARAIPMSATQSLRIISYLSLAITYFLILMVCLRLRISPMAAAAGLIVLFTSPWHFYNYHNPFLTDAFGLATLSLMIYALFSDSFNVFAMAALIGILARETCAFLVPAWLLKDCQKGVSITIVALTLTLSLRIALSSHLDMAVANAFQGSGFHRLLSPLNFVEDIIISWRSAWLITIVGLCLFTGQRFLLMGTAFTTLLCGAFFTSMVAADPERMFIILSPIVAIASAQVFMTLLKKKLQIWIYILLGSLIGCSLVSIPNVVLGEEMVNGARGIKLAAMVGNTLIVIVVAGLLKNDILAAISYNRKFLTSRLRRITIWKKLGTVTEHVSK